MFVSGTPTPIRDVGNYIEVDQACDLLSLTLCGKLGGSRVVVRNGTTTAIQLLPEAIARSSTQIHLAWPDGLRCSSGLCLLITADIGATAECNTSYRIP